MPDLELEPEPELARLPVDENATLSVKEPTKPKMAQNAIIVVERRRPAYGRRGNST
ncbi:MAG: hypothetical protein ACR2H5_20265 [Ktedonobacteraceae bacterium]